MKKENARLTVAQKKALLASGRTADWTRIIYGEPASMKNSRKIVRINGVSRLVKGDKAQAYAHDFLRQCPVLDPLFEGDVHVEMEIYYASRRPDIDEHQILDLMQGRIYRNDRQVRSKAVKGYVDPESPRVAIRVTLVALGPWSGNP
jgi:Holliday junction resolvase RusA-like endonuclease